MVLDKQIIEKYLEKVVKKAENDSEIVGVIVFGSYTNPKSYFEDVDVVLVCKENLDEKKMLEKRIEYLRMLPDVFDVQIFQMLPLVIQKDVLNGRVLYETSYLYDIAYQIMKKYEDIKRYREDYIKRSLS